MTLQAIADAYFAAMRAQDPEALLSLLAPDAMIVWPDGRAITGLPAIREAYARLFAMPSNNPEPDPPMIAADRFATEVRSALPDGSERRTLNVFRLSAEGRIARLDSYRQG